MNDLDPDLPRAGLPLVRAEGPAAGTPAPPAVGPGISARFAPTGRARWALGPLLLAMALGQLVDLPGFVEILRSYRFGPSAAAVLLALLLIAGELVAGVGLVRPRPSRGSASVGVAVTFAWTLLGLQAFARGIALESCGCFGTFFAQPLRWWILVEDAEFVLLALFVNRAVISRDRAMTARAVTRERVSGA